MNYETRLKKPPVSSLTDDTIDKNKNKWYSLDEVERDDQKNKKISSQTVSEDIYSRGKLGRNTNGQELDNSSFSFDLDKYIFDDEFYNQFQYEDKSKITKTISELKQELNAIDENTDSGWEKGYKIRQQIRALETGYTSEYDYVVGREKERLTKDYKLGKLDKKTDKKKKLEIKKSQLEQDIKESSPFKKAQYKIIQETNPMFDEEHVGIRSPKDIKTFEEIINDEESFTWGDYSKEDALRDLKRGKVRVYSSYTIKNGVFVSTSYQQALDYASGNPSKVHSREVALNSVAWINGDEGQYAKIYDTKYSLPTKDWNEYLKEKFPSDGTKTKMSDINLPLKDSFNNTNNSIKVLNPNEISKLTEEDANTTPILAPLKNKNKYNDGKSKYAKNIEDKVNMLKDEQKEIILNSDDVKYYDKVTNKESLDKAFERLNNNGKIEVTKWFNKKENIDSTDIAEGYILLKQYSDKVMNTTDLNMKNYYNDMLVETAKQMRHFGTTAGQTVQAFNIMERMTPEGMVKYAQSELSEAFDKLIKNKSKKWIDKYKKDFDLKPDEVQFIMKTMQEVSRMEDGYEKRVKLAEIQKIMTDKLPPEKGAGIKAWLRISMLFNSKTQVRNVFGNALIAPVNAFGDLFASKVDSYVSTKTKVRTVGKSNLTKYKEGFKTGVYQSYNDFKKGINTRNVEGNRFEITQGKSFNDKSIIGNKLNKVDSLLSFMLDAGDRGFYEASFTNSINNQLILNNTDKVTQDMIDIATSEALSRTWQDNNSYTNFVLKARAGLNQIIGTKEFGIGDVLIPFAKTPANLTKAIIDYSPVGMVSAITKGVNLKNAIETGRFTPKMQHEFVQSLGKATAGTVLYALGIALAKVGITSGESDDDKDTRNFLKNTLGINSYSIKIGDKTFTYDWMQPLTAPISITANIEKNRKENQNLVEAITSALNTAGSVLLEQSFMESINTVLNNNDGVVTGLQEALFELPSRAIPTLSKQIVDLIDGTQRQTFEYNAPLKTAINKVKAKIPGLSNTLAPSVDTLGREIEKYGGKNGLFNVFLNPSNVNNENLSNSAREIYRLYKETGDKSIMPRVSPYYINKDEKIILSSKQRADYQKISGSIIENNVNELLNNETYKTLSDVEKASVINEIVNYSYNIAQKEVLNLDISDKYNKTYQYSKVGNISDYYLVKSQSFTSDKDSNGKSISGSKKNKVISYINSMQLTIPQKAILINLNGYKLKYYDNQVIDYINNSNNTINSKKELLNTLGYEIYTQNGKTFVK